ncbi:MAG: hypothetical protein V2A76_04195 [Planctomycetota bacterium]
MFAPLLCLALLASDPAPMEIVRRTYDLSDVLPAMTEEATGFRTLPLIPNPYLGQDEFGTARCEYMFPSDLLADLLRQTVMPEEWEYEGRSVETQGFEERNLVVEAPVAVQKEVERFLDYVSRAVNTPIEVSFHVYGIGGDTGQADLPLGSLDERGIQEIEQLAASGRLHRVRSFRLEMHSGIPESVMDIVRIPYLRDYDVEIAQSSAIAQPVVDSYPEGVALLARADRDTENRILVSFGLRRSWNYGPPLEMDARSISTIAAERGTEQITVGGRLQSPRVAFTTLASSVRLRPGESTSVLISTLGESGPVDGTFVVIRVGKVPQAPAAFESGERYLSIRDVGGHFASGFPDVRFSQSAMRFSRDSVAEEDQLPLEVSLGPISENQLAEIEPILSTVSNEFEEEDGEYVSIGMAANFVYLCGGREVANFAMTRLLTLLPRGFTTRGVAGSLADIDKLQGGKTAPLFAFPAGAGNGFAVSGSQETYILEYDADVANNSNIANPNVEAIVNGWALRFDTAGTLDGQGAVHLKVQSHLRTEGRKELSGTLVGMGGIYLPAFRSNAAEGVVRGEESARIVETSLPPGPSVLLVRRLD